MIYCESPTLEQWLAPPQDNLPRPTWTKMFAGGVMLSNSIECADWAASPVDPIVCEACWNPGCAMEGLARIVRIGDHLLWLPRRPRDIPESLPEWLNKAAFISEAVLMPAASWEELRNLFPKLPPTKSYPLAVRGDAATAWISEMPEAVRVGELGGLDARLREALASDPLDLEPAREVVQRLVGWVHERPERPMKGQLVLTCPHFLYQGL
jgi:hypothetical protein